MENDSSPPNPFDPTAQELPFAGRAQADAQLSQHLADPSRLGAVGYSGRRNIGKTRLLRHFQATAQPTSLMAYIGLDENLFKDEATLIHAIATISRELVTAQGYMATGDLEIPDEIETPRVWLEEFCLPTVFRVIRPHRRLVWLIDDAQTLIDALETVEIARDFPTYLRNLLNNQLALVMTLDIDAEDHIDYLHPLLDINNIHRLSSLTLDDTRSLMSQVFQSPVTEEAVESIYLNSGGEPHIINQFGYRLYNTYAQNMMIDVDQVREIIPTLIDDCHADFQHIWDRRTQDERQVLIAIAIIHYTRPLDTIKPESIEAWLVETDYLMDETAIAAALRSLEFDEIIASSEESVTFASRLFQRWILRFATPDTPVSLPQTATTEGQSRNIWLGVAAAAITILLLLALLLFTEPSENNQAASPEPTVTLAGES